MKQRNFSFSLNGNGKWQPEQTHTQIGIDTKWKTPLLVLRVTKEENTEEQKNKYAPQHQRKRIGMFEQNHKLISY